MAGDSQQISKHAVKMKDSISEVAAVAEAASAETQQVSASVEQIAASSQEMARGAEW